MQHDYDAFLQMQEKLCDSLCKLEQAERDLEKANGQKDEDKKKKAKEKAEDDKQSAAEDSVSIEPHLAYLWFEAKG